MRVPLLVDDFLRRAAQLYPDKTAIVDGARRYTYREYQERSNRLAHVLLESGIGKGDRVCILSPNSHHFLESFYATSAVGAVLVPLNYRLAAPELEYIIGHSSARMLIVDPEYTGIIDRIRERLGGVQAWLVATDAAARAGESWTELEALMATAPDCEPSRPAVDEDDLVSINYTSGTTARPKGVMLTHRNCYLNAYNFIAHLRLRHEDVELWTLPMFHCNGWGAPYALTALGGTHVVLRSVDARRIFELIETERITFACMAPIVLAKILDYPERSRHKIATRPRFVLAGAPPPASHIERLETELGWEFMQIYGLTETAPILTTCTPDHRTEAGDWARRCRAGVPAIGVTLEVLDDEGHPVPKDDVTVGEVCARSNVVFAGYWNDAEETEKAFRGGVFHTGDLAVWDEGGSLHIVDRKKDVIISGGENISSAEIEGVLYAHPAVRECAVIGVPHEKWGETPRALVVLRDGGRGPAGTVDAGEAADEPAGEAAGEAFAEPVTEAILLEFCRERLAHFKCPTSVEFVTELPRTATGKLQKYRLREAYWEGRKRRVN